MTAADLFAAISLALAIASVTCAVYAWQERQYARRQEIRGDENWMWAEHHREEADAALRRVHVMERRYANLQSMYGELVRRRIAANTSLIVRNANKENFRHDRN